MGVSAAKMDGETLPGPRGVTLSKATHPFALFFPSANGRKVSRVFREGERDLRELTRMRCLSRRRKRRRKQSEDWPLVTAHRIFDGDRTMLARASHQVGRTPHSDGTASGDMLCRMKIKPAAELRFDDLVNQPTISITRTAIQWRRQMCQPVSRLEPPGGFRP